MRHAISFHAHAWPILLNLRAECMEYGRNLLHPHYGVYHKPIHSWIITESNVRELPSTNDVGAEMIMCNPLWSTVM